MPCAAALAAAEHEPNKQKKKKEKMLVFTKCFNKYFQCLTICYVEWIGWLSFLKWNILKWKKKRRKTTQKQQLLIKFKDS